MKDATAEIKIEYREVQTSVLEKVICVACKRDMDVWKIASLYIPEYIYANKYEVIVPDNEVNVFKSHTNPKFEVVCESTYLNGIDLGFVRDHLVNYKELAGWYLQQFIKINACRLGDERDVYLVWDADTVPLKRLDFFDSAGRLKYFKGTENHTDYFNTIHKILGLQKKVDFSFIAQCFPIKRNWAKEFCDEIERRSGTDWVVTVLASISGDTPSGFSEYESLGTFLTYKYPNDFITIDNCWSRYGNLLVGGIDNVNLKVINSLSKQYDYMAFEHSQRKEGFVKRQLRRIWLYLRKLRSVQSR
jgi:hypothetical protein